MDRFALTLVPLVLLAACGGDEPTEETVATPEPSERVANEPDPDRMPAPNADGVDTIDYSGSYTFTGIDGSHFTLTLDKEAGTYEYVSPDGTTSGNYKKLDSGRIAITNFDGSAGYFSIAPGALYRLADATSPFDEIDLGRMYRRSDYVADAGPGAALPSIVTTNTVADKREK
ncbi:hypothetical protein [Aurantiacibacter flavus]|uniref:Copper resistance protein NlpE n=1 Tax=Aurantiacibacter flavus TaxID=3145232 RepID=A0ABV0CYN6_9SPHN